ncbi:ERF family protein [Staphylococcus auricularis]|uniref:ERF family protein n=1 Tax=Staphylococcus auricularis TaxID=29379 RepID=UPI001EF2D88C|nr:ERF family protein [Staphylococcus auricularis]MCG7342353.1 ERF family protein [Staphylococcus auricularis]
MAEQMNLYQKIADVKAHIDGFTKDTKGYNYSYVSGSQILYRIRNKMIEHHLLLVPCTEDETISETSNTKGKVEHIVQFKLTYKWINADNPQEVLEVPFFGVGQQDDVSKAHGTALTYAERYFLLKFFNIPTDEDDGDAKQKQDFYATSNQQMKALLQKEVREFIRIVKDSNHQDKYQDQIKRLGKMNIDQLTRQQMEVTRKQINKWIGEIES